MNLKQSFIEAKDVARLQWKSFLAAFVTLFSFYVASLTVPTGWITWTLCLPPALVMILIVYSRVNDIGVEKMGRRWQARRIGLILSGAAVGTAVATPFMNPQLFPSWIVVTLFYGVAMTWTTTPGQPPMDVYILGDYDPESAKGRLWRHTLGRIFGSGVQ